MGEQTHHDELAMLRAEIELLMSERRNLLRATGAAAVFLAKLDSHALPESTYNAADVLAATLSDLSEDTLRDAIELIRKEEGAIVRIRADDDLDS